MSVRNDFIIAIVSDVTTHDDFFLMTSRKTIPKDTSEAINYFRRNQTRWKVKRFWSFKIKIR